MVPKGKWSFSILIQPILFCSKLLTTAKRKYWPTKPEIASFIQVMEKFKYLVESFRTNVIIQTDHVAILDIMQRSSITSTSSTIMMNIRLVRALQVLQQLRFIIWHKPRKEHIIPDELSKLTSGNNTSYDMKYFELDSLFVNYTTQVEIDLALVECILDGYITDNLWAKVYKQVLDNEKLDENKTLLPFDIVDDQPSVLDPYFQPRPETLDSTPPRANSLSSETQLASISPGKSKLIFHLDCLMDIYHLFIPPSMAPELLAIAYDEEYPDFARCYKIIFRSWFIQGLIKLLRSFIRNCSKYLAFQIRRHPF